MFERNLCRCSLNTSMTSLMTLLKPFVTLGCFFHPHFFFFFLQQTFYSLFFAAHVSCILASKLISLSRLIYTSWINRPKKSSNCFHDLGPKLWGRFLFLHQVFFLALSLTSCFSGDLSSHLLFFPLCPCRKKKCFLLSAERNNKQYWNHYKYCNTTLTAECGMSQRSFVYNRLFIIVLIIFLLFIFFAVYVSYCMHNGGTLINSCPVPSVL